eukprot:scaffold157332_cov17-Tisochrysis_lutea.AAC.1
MRRQEACMLWQHVYKAQLSLRSGSKRAPHVQQQPHRPGTCTPSEEDSPLAEENEEEGQGEGQGQEEVMEDAVCAEGAGAVHAGADGDVKPSKAAKQGEGSGSGSGDSIATQHQPVNRGAGSSGRKGSLDAGDRTRQQVPPQPRYTRHNDSSALPTRTTNGGGSGDSTCMEEVFPLQQQQQQQQHLQGSHAALACGTPDPQAIPTAAAGTSPVPSTHNHPSAGAAGAANAS